MNATCPNDTNGDGDCHICHKRPSGCIYKPLLLQRFGWNEKAQGVRKCDNGGLVHAKAVIHALEYILESELNPHYAMKAMLYHLKATDLVQPIKDLES